MYILSHLIKTSVCVCVCVCVRARAHVFVCLFRSECPRVKLCKTLCSLPQWTFATFKTWCCIEITRTWCGYKITGLNFFRFPVNLAAANGVWYWLVLSPPFTVTISRSCGKQFGCSLCLKWIVFLFSVGFMLSVNVEQSVNVKFCVKLGNSATET